MTIIIEFDYDSDENNYKDDFVRIKIYDNLLGWYRKNGVWVRRNDGKEISLEEIDTLLKPSIREFHGKRRDGRIIDETGDIVQGAWGFKEMRICASFLRGLQISEYENSDIDPPVITAICVPDKND